MYPHSSQPLDCCSHSWTAPSNFRQGFFSLYLYNPVIMYSVLSNSNEICNYEIGEILALGLTFAKITFKMKVSNIN